MPLPQYKQQQQNKSTKHNRNKRAVKLAKWVCFNDEIQKQNTSKLRAHLVLCEYAILIIQSFMVTVFAGITQTYLLRILLSTYMHHETTFLFSEISRYVHWESVFYSVPFLISYWIQVSDTKLIFLFFLLSIDNVCFFSRIVFIRLSMLAVWIWQKFGWSVLKCLKNRIRTKWIRIDSKIAEWIYRFNSISLPFFHSFWDTA